MSGSTTASTEPTCGTAADVPTAVVIGPFAVLMDTVSWGWSRYVAEAFELSLPDAQGAPSRGHELLSAPGMDIVLKRHRDVRRGDLDGEGHLIGVPATQDHGGRRRLAPRHSVQHERQVVRLEQVRTTLTEREIIRAVRRIRRHQRGLRGEHTPGQQKPQRRGPH